MSEKSAISRFFGARHKLLARQQPIVRVPMLSNERFQVRVRQGRQVPAPLHRLSLRWRRCSVLRVVAIACTGPVVLHTIIVYLLYGKCTGTTYIQ